ncbi:hypothetical protein E4K10_01265 [Streptomyces sp. T1317-0309]|nr:hypothetical protein E4K10_01265 [Streptomyces sp. T1317-0309]
MRIGTGETVDAAQALEALGLADRERLREGLAATLLHGEAQRQVFDPVFDVYFPRRWRPRGSGGHGPGGAAGPARGGTRRQRRGDDGAVGRRRGGRLRRLRLLARFGRLVVVPDA